MSLLAILSCTYIGHLCLSLLVEEFAVLSFLACKSLSNIVFEFECVGWILTVLSLTPLKKTNFHLQSFLY